jgi:hypothetical protein
MRSYGATASCILNKTIQKRLVDNLPDYMLRRSAGISED